MTVGQVLTGVRLRKALPQTLAEKDVAGLEYDSRRVEKGFVFFAFAGSRVDGRQFALDAHDRGALAVASELPQPPDFTGDWIEVEHGRQALAIASRNLYRAPDARIFFTGITGTNGKTTTSYLIDGILRASSAITGLIGTIQYRLGDDRRPASNTTPESLDILRFASELESRGGKHLISEVSSHALALGRTFGMQFHTVVFTNLTRDHLDFHGTMEEYGAAKRLLFAPKEGPVPLWAVVNADDPAAESMMPGSGTRVIRYGLSQMADLRAEHVRSSFSGLQFDVAWEGKSHRIESSLLGQVNVLNILAAVGVGLSYGLEFPTILRGIAGVKAVPGRFEPVAGSQPFMVAVDYAHTDDALRNAIRTARNLTKGRVITLFGCGGDRDRTKRPLMGMAAGELSDYVVLTSDNPRSEDPLSIMNDALVGLGRFDTPYAAEPDRAKGIRLALDQARPGDVVLVAGKGHETYQILKDHTIHFDDRETAREVLRSFGYTVSEPEGQKQR